VTSDGTSNDLTTYAKGNTSLPSGGVQEKSTRFNGAKLNAYLHSLNTQLAEENQNLIKTLSSTAKQVARLQKDNERLEDKMREMSISFVEKTRDGSDEEDGGRIAMLEKQLEGLVASHEGINTLQQRLVNEAGNNGPQSELEAARVADLEAKIEQGHQALTARDAEVEKLRTQVMDLQSATGKGDNSSELARELQREVFNLKDQLDAVEQERDARTDEVVKLTQQVTESASAHEREMAALNARADELLIALEQKDGEVQRAKAETEEQENEFADKMAKLEEELCRVMEEQESHLDKAREEAAETLRASQAALVEADSRLTAALERVSGLEDDIAKVTKERDEAIHSSSGDRESSRRLRQLREEVTALQSTLKTRDAELQELRARPQIESRREDENLRQVEEALEESSHQLMQKEEELAELRIALASEKSVVASLSAQISQLSVHKTKARSPLANEVLGTDEVVAELEEELQEARNEINQLRKRLTSPQAVRATVELKDMEIRNLESHKQELEDRVSSLRQQVSAGLTPRKTPDKSMLFKSIVGVATPKTPGQFLSNVRRPFSMIPDGSLD
jgi:chromosome segregation ATPase